MLEKKYLIFYIKYLIFPNTKVVRKSNPHPSRLQSHACAPEPRQPQISISI